MRLSRTTIMLPSRTGIIIPLSRSTTRLLRRRESTSFSGFPSSAILSGVVRITLELDLRTSTTMFAGANTSSSNATINYTFSRMRPAVRIPFAPATRHCEPLGPLSRALILPGAGTSTGDLRPGRAKPKRLPRPPESWRVCFTTRCDSVCLMKISEVPTYEQRYRQRVLHNLQRRAQSLGLTLIAKTATTEAVS